MKSLIIENQYLGSINYYKMLFDYSYIEIEQYEYFQKMSFRNRCIIPGSNGLLQLSVPLQNGRNQTTLFKEVKIAYAENWVAHHCRSFEACYNRAPFFEFYKEALFQILEKKSIFLFDLNWELMQWVLNKLKSSPKIHFTTQYQLSHSDDIFDARNTILPKNYQLLSEPIKYTQVFEDRVGFMPNMSILDLLFSVGPSALTYLKSNI